MCILFFVSKAFWALDLSLSANDVRIEPHTGGGYDLFIRKTEHISSVLLTETTKDPTGKEDNYTYRIEEKNSINGDEKRILNGEFLTSKYAQYSLVDSTPQKDSVFGDSFHIYIPKTLIWGYPWTRNGTTTIGIGTFINIRTFEKTFADYDGDFFDNPFMFDFREPKKKTSLPKADSPKVITLTDDYNIAAAKAFEEISSGGIIYSEGSKTLSEDVINSFKRINPKDAIDVVFAIDATSSMWDDIKELQENLIPFLKEELEKCGDVRLGLLFYRDYSDNFSLDGLPVKLYSFTHDSSIFFKNLNSMSVRKGSAIGGDIPEAVYEALYASISYYPWSPEAQRKIILIGDAEPHPKPRGLKKIGKDTVEKLAQLHDITIDCIITPDKEF